MPGWLHVLAIAVEHARKTETQNRTDRTLLVKRDAVSIALILGVLAILLSPVFFR